MNAIYKVIYCIRTQSWKAASEFSKSRGKKSSVRGGSGSFLRPNFSLSILPLALLAALSGQQVLAEDAVCVDPNDPTIPVGTTNANADQVACGKGANASGPSSVAVGAGANASGNYAIAIGLNAKSQAGQSIALGNKANAKGDQSIAIGGESFAKGNSSIAIGGDDLDRVASTAPPAWNAGVTDLAAAEALNDTDVAKAYKALTGDILVHYENNQYSTDATKKGDPNGTQRFTPTETGAGAVAIGVSSTAADLATSFGTRANAYGVTSLALGVGSQAGVKGATGGAGDGAVAIGPGTKALGTKSIAQGTGSAAYTQGSIAIGDAAVAGVDGSTTNLDAIAIGTGAKATGNQSISIGYKNVVSGNNSGAIGDPNTISGSGSYALGNNNTIAQDNTFVVGNGVTTTQANSVVLGNLSTDRAATTVKNATINGTTYGTFAGPGSAANGVVSVGGVGTERQLINVAAGEVSATSTDAINGSQLYAVAESAQHHYFSVNSTGGGNYNNDGAKTVNSIAIGRNSVAGDSTDATKENAVALGFNSQATQWDTTAIGSNATATADRATSVGYGADATGDSASAFGRDAQATVESSTALGRSSRATAKWATAVGSNAYAKSEASTAVGVVAQALAKNSVAIGRGAVVDDATKAENGISIGTAAKTTQKDAISMGTNAEASGRDAVAIGTKAKATSADAFALGELSQASGANSLALGSESQANTQSAVAIGRATSATGTGSTAIGGGAGSAATANGSGAVAIGGGYASNVAAKASASRTVAIGNAANASVTDAVALGSKSVADRKALTGVSASATPTGNQVFASSTASVAEQLAITNTVKGSLAAVSVGSSSATRQITNVAAGRDDTDAVNVAQLKAVSNAANRENYFHTNPTATKVAESGTNNKDVVDGVGAATGEYASAAGYNASASGTRSSALGVDSLASGNQSSAFGDDAEAKGNNSLAMGSVSRAGAQGATAIGSGATVRTGGTSGTVVGTNASGAAFDVSIGSGALATGGSDADGYITKSGGQNTAIGYESGKNLAGNKNSALGFQSGSNLNGNGNSVLGYRSGISTTGDRNTLIGHNAGGGGYGAAFAMQGNDNVGNGSGALGAANGANNIGLGTVAGAQVTGSNNVAIGFQAGTLATFDNKTGNPTAGLAQAYNNAVNIGSKTQALADSAVAVGDQAKASAKNALSLGSTSTATAESATAVGYHADARADSASAFGRDADAKAESSIAVGRNSTAEAKQSTAIGAYSQAYEADSVALGAATEAFKANSTAVGSFADAKEVNSTALGSNSSANLADSVALGSGSVADRKAGFDGYNPITGAVDAADAGITATKSTLAAVSVGSAGNTRQIINVAAGTQDSDAVNVAQLKALRTGLIGYEAGVGGFALKAQDGKEVTQSLGKSIEVVGGATTTGTYTSNNVRTVVNGGKIEIQLAESPKFGNVVINDGGTGKITGVTAGEISATSTQAVNGSQIHNIADQNATNVFGGNSTVNADGSTSFTDVGGTGENNIHDAIQSVNKTANAGFTIAGASATTATDAKIVPTDTLNIVGADANTDFSQSDAGKNIYTVVDADNTVRIGLANDLDVTSVKAQTVNATTSVIIGDASDPANSTTLTSTANGLDVGGDKITNVGAGDISATSTDAVNGSQIHNIADQNATNVFGGNATVNADGSTSFTDIGGTGENTIHDAISNVYNTANAGFTIAGASATTATDAKIVPTDTLNIVGAAANTDFSQSDAGKNIYTVVDANNTVRIGLANDLDVTSVKAQTVNATTSVTIGDASDPANSTTLTSGANGLDVGGDKITNVAAGDISSTSTDAVNGSQVHNIASQNATNVFGGNATVNADGSTSFTNVGGTGENTIHDAIQSVNKTANAGFTIAGASATTATDAKIVPTDTLNIVGADANTDFSQSDAGKNIYTVVDANNTVRIGLANDLDVTSVKAQTVNATTSVTIGDASDPANSTTLTSGANGLDVGGDKITNVAAGDISSTSTDAVNGSQVHNIASQNATNVFGGNATVNADGSTSFTNIGGTGENNLHDAIQSISTVAGKHSTVEAGSNIVVTPTTTDGQTNYVVSTSQNMSLESVQVSQGLSVSNGATVDMGNNRVQNVAAGVNPTDAVNYAQLMSAYSYTNQLAAEANAGVASAIATANLPQPHDPGASMFSIGAGHHGNQQAIAIGLSAISDNGRWVLKGSLSTDTKSNVSAGVGVGYQW